MPKCIICHMEIVEGKEMLRQCPNGHPVHDECLQEWLVHSPNCPLCNASYTQEILEKGKDYVKQKTLQKDKEERKRKIEKIAEKILSLKFVNTIEEFLENKQFDQALDMLDRYQQKELSDEKKRNILFLKGKTFYLKGRYDMAIGTLFKLVKDKYDYPEAFLYLGKAYQELGLEDKAKWAFERIPK